MAIAYFIPDQAKLLARTGGNNSSRASQATSTSAAAANNTRRPTRPTTTSQQQTQPQGQTHYTYGGNRHNQFRANISIPLARQQGSMTTGTQAENLGCWDLLAQIFCYALRFYNYNSAQRRPTVIQISFEISNVGDDGGNGDESGGGSDNSSSSSAGKRH